MATADTIINSAFRIAGVDLAPGRNFATSTSQKIEALEVFNNFLGTFRLPSMNWFEVQSNVHTLIPGHNPHTIGTGGDFNQPRPVQILGASLRYLQSTPDIDLDLIQLTWAQYKQISIKAIESQLPQYFYYDAAFSSATDPKGNVYLWMVPSQANEIVIYTPEILTEPATLATVMLLPPGYQRMLNYNLAVEFAALYRKRFNDPRADAVMYQQAKESLYWVKVNNAIPLDMQSDAATWGPEAMWDFRTGLYRFQ